MFYTFGIILAVCVLTRAQDYSKSMQDAYVLLAEVPLIDGHNDFPINLQLNFDGQFDRVNLEDNLTHAYWHPVTNSHTDIPRMREGRVGGQFWSVFTTCNVQYKDAVEKALQLIDLVKRFSRKHDSFFALATSVEEIWAAFNSSKVASLIGVEGGHMISSNLGNLRMFYELGVRYLTLTWNCNTPWADYCNADDDELTPTNGGLTPFGKAIVLEMNRLGMMVDLSHVAVTTMRDALNVSLAPVIFSHSCVYSICPITRNVPDDILLRLKENGGILMINFYSNFLNCSAVNRDQPGPRSSDINSVIEHMQYIKDFIGVDHIGIGSDFEGISSAPIGLEDTSKYPNLVSALLDAGWSREDVKKVVGLNILRVLGQVEQVRDMLVNQPPNETIMKHTRIPDLRCKILPNWDL